MDKLKKISLIIISFSIFVGCIAYTTKSSRYTGFSVLILGWFFLVLFMNPNGFSVLGFFLDIKEDIDIYKFLFGKDFDYANSWKFIAYQYIIMVIPLIISAVILFFNYIPLLVGPGTTLGISLISLGAALGILSFNYYNALPDSDDKEIIFSSAKRYFMATILAIISLLLIVTVGYVNSSMINIEQQIFLSPFNFISYYLIFAVYTVSLIFYTLFLMMTLRHFIEGIILSFKGTLDFTHKK